MSEKNKQPFYIGDPKFSRKMFKLYGWIMTVVFSCMTLLMLITKAWLTALIFLVGAVVMTPYMKNKLEKYKFNSIAKFVFCAIVIIAGMYSTGLYL